MKKFATVPEYLRAVPPKSRAALQKIRRTIKAAAPGAVDAISYGMPAFKYRGRMLVCYAAFKDHCSFFPASYAVITANRAALKSFETAKGTIRFVPEKPLPVTLVKRMVKARVRETDARAAG